MYWICKRFDPLCKYLISYKLMRKYLHSMLCSNINIDMNTLFLRTKWTEVQCWLSLALFELCSPLPSPEGNIRFPVLTRFSLSGQVVHCGFIKASWLITASCCGYKKGTYNNGNKEAKQWAERCWNAQQNWLELEVRASFSASDNLHIDDTFKPINCSFFE